MIWPGTEYMIPLIVAVAFLVGSSLYLWYRHHTSAARTLVLILLSSSTWVVCRILNLSSSTPQIGILLERIEYIPLTLVYVAWFIFTLQYTGREKWVTRRNVALIALIPLVTLLLVFTSDYHPLMSNLVTSLRDGRLIAIKFYFGPWFYIHTAYAVSLLLFSDFLLIHMLIFAGRFYRWQIILLLIVSGFFLVGLLPFPVLSLLSLPLIIALLLSIACPAFALSIYRFRMADIVPVARGAIIDSMSDGVMVLDAQNRILDVNPLICQVIGVPASELIGQPVEKVWPHWIDHTRPGNLQRREITLDIHGQRTFDMRISPLTDNHGNLVSQIVVLRDITDSKKAEMQLKNLFEASKLINSTMDIDRIYKAVSDACQELVGFENFMIFLFSKKKIYPVYVLGKIKDIIKDVVLDYGEGLVGYCIRTRETLLLKNAHEDGRGKVIGTLKMSSQIIVPLIIEDDCVGALHISKAEENAYDEEDVDILKLFSEVVSSAIRNSNLYQEIKKSGEELEERIKERSRKMEIILNTRLNLQKETSLEQGLSTIVDSMEALGFDRVGVFLVDSGREKLNYYMGRGVDLPVDTSISLKKTEYIGVKCILEKKTIHMKDSSITEGVQIVHAKSFVWVPIVVEDEAFAALVASYMKENVTEEDVKDLEILAGMCAAFIDRTRIQIEPVTENMLKTEIMYQLNPGECYLVIEKKPEKSFEIFVDLVTHGISGFIVSRESPERVKEKYNLVKTPILWLSRSEREYTISPDDLSKLSYIIEDFTKKSTESVILIDGLEYLITQIGFDAVLKHVQELRDTMILNNSRLVIPVHKETLSVKEYSILERQFTILERC